MSNIPESFGELLGNTAAYAALACPEKGYDRLVYFAKAGDLKAKRICKIFEAIVERSNFGYHTCTVVGKFSQTEVGIMQLFYDAGFRVMFRVECSGSIAYDLDWKHDGEQN